MFASLRLLTTTGFADCVQKTSVPFNLVVLQFSQFSNLGKKWAAQLFASIKVS